MALNYWFVESNNHYERRIKIADRMLQVFRQLTADEVEAVYRERDELRKQVAELEAENKELHLEVGDLIQRVQD